MSPETAVGDLTTRARVALDTCRTVHAPDDRTSCFDLDVHPSDDSQRFTLTGTVETERLLGRARSSVRKATGRAVTARDVTILEGRENQLTVATSGVPVRARPGTAEKQVTQALFGDDVREYERQGGWTRVRMADGHLGWIETDRLVEATPIDTDAVVSERVDSSEHRQVMPGVECKVLEASDDAPHVEFRTGGRMRVPGGTISRRETQSALADVVDCARSFHGTPYEPGGKTERGIDCAGLAWVAYRSVGVTLPRDPDQQRRVGVEVDPGELEPGDLLFFPGHVAISLGGREYIHADSEADEVVTNSLDTDAGDHRPGLGDEVTTARRVVER